jgi:biopolymer transport protein ExbB
MSLCLARARPFVWAAVLAAAACCPGPGCGALGAEAAPAPAKAAPAAAPSPDKAPPAPSSPPTAEKRREDLEKAAEPISIGRVLWEKTNVIGWMFYAAEGTLSVMAMTLAMERFVRLRRRKFVPRRFLRRLHDLMARREDTAENLFTLCEGSESPISNVLRAGVLRAGRPLLEVEKALEDAVIRESIAQRGRNRMLGVIGTIAPMVGLLGTVVGMILAFRVTSVAGTGKAEMLAEGIYLALLRTAFGLVIAVPSLYLFHHFNTRVERFMRQMVEVLEETIPSFAAMEKTATVEPDGEVMRASPPLGRVKRS